MVYNGITKKCAKEIYMDQNDILSNKLIKRINKIEKLDAKLQHEKENVRQDIIKEISKKTFDELIDKVEENGYPDEQLIVENIRKKEIERQKIEFDDYIAVVRMYTTTSQSNNKSKE